MQDQNADNRPSECTGYTVTDIAADQDGFLYSPDFNFMNTLVLMNAPPDTDGADLRIAFKVPVGIGMIALDDEPAQVLTNSSQAWAANPANWPADINTTAAQFRKPAYIPVSPFGQDWFDTVRSALLKSTEKRAVGVGTPWSPSFEGIGKDGILGENPTNLYWGHAYVICGWKQINGKPYLIAKTWQGKNYGDNGYCYYSRTLFNKIMSNWGTFACTLQDLPANTIDELKSQKLALFDIIAALLKNIYIAMKR